MPLEEIEDTKGVIRIHKSKNDKQQNGQKKKVQKDKQQSTKHTYKTKDWVTETSLNTWWWTQESGCLKRAETSIA